MRIVVTTRHWSRVGGAEAYVERLLQMLVEAGHDVVVVFDLNRHSSGPGVAIPEGVETHCIEIEGRDAVIGAINAMEDAIVFANSIESPLFTRNRAVRHPVALYVHDFVATCISGTRLHRRPTPAPCGKTFGPACLVHYFPRRCGGLSPLTMLTSYRRQELNRRTLSTFELVIANSAAVALHLGRSGIKATVLHPAMCKRPGLPRTGFVDESRRSLTFVSRFEDYKGGGHLLSALPRVATRLGVPVHVTMVGDGRKREEWERDAAAIARRFPAITVRFTGWLPEEGVARIYEASDLLVIPSLWPEPFGLVGLEAARFGLPSAAFAVGGIPEWLSDGVNGRLAGGHSCSRVDLADAIVRCLADVEDYRRLSTGAVDRRAMFAPEAHLRSLESLLESVIEPH